MVYIYIAHRLQLGRWLVQFLVALPGWRFISGAAPGAHRLCVLLWVRVHRPPRLLRPHGPLEDVARQLLGKRMQQHVEVVHRGRRAHLAHLQVEHAVKNNTVGNAAGVGHVGPKPPKRRRDGLAADADAGPLSLG